MTIFLFEAIRIINDNITLCLHNIYFVSIHTANPNVYAAKIRLYFKKTTGKQKNLFFFLLPVENHGKSCIFAAPFSPHTCGKMAGRGALPPFYFSVFVRILPLSCRVPPLRVLLFFWSCALWSYTLFFDLQI